MPLEDFVSPIIRAYLQGQQLKRNKEQDILRKQEAEDESKIRQAQAQKLAKEIAHFDKNAELEDEQKRIAVTIAKNNMKHQFLTDVAEGRRKIPQVVIEVAREAAMQGDWNDELATPGMQGMLDRTPKIGIPETFDIGGGVTMNRGELVSPEEMRANKVANEQALNAPKIALAQAANDIATGGQLKILGKRNEYDVANREDEQLYKTGEADKTRANALEVAGINRAAIAAENRLNRANDWSIANMHETAATERNNADNALKMAFDESAVKDFVDKSVAHSLTTKERISQLAKPFRERIQAEAQQNGYIIHTDKEKELLSDLQILNRVHDKLKVITKKIGNGAEITAATGGLTELGKELKALDIYKPVLAKLTSVKGTQSDQDTKIAGGNLAETWGLGVAEENKRRMDAILEMQAEIFRQHFPVGTNPIQIANSMKTYDIDPQGWALYNKRQEERKAQGAKK